MAYDGRGLWGWETSLTPLPGLCVFPRLDSARLTPWATIFRPLGSALNRPRCGVQTSLGGTRRGPYATLIQPGLLAVHGRLGDCAEAAFAAVELAHQIGRASCRERV